MTSRWGSHCGDRSDHEQGAAWRLANGRGSGAAAAALPPLPLPASARRSLPSLLQAVS